MLKKFCEVTSCNGVIDLYEAKANKCQFAFWTTFMTCMIGVSVYFTYATIKGYANTPSVTNVAPVHEKVLDLPEIMICHKGGMNISAMLGANFSTELAKAFAGVPGVGVSKEMNQELINYRLSQNLTMKDVYEKFSHRCEEMILSVRRTTGAIKTVKDSLQCENATSLWSYRGICYLLKDYKQYNPEAGGLTIVLQELLVNYKNVYSDKELKTLNNGYSITMQKSFDNQFSLDGEVSIPMNSGVTILLTPKRYIRLPKSTKCDSRNDTYTSNRCTENCYQDANIEACHCKTTYVGSARRHEQFDYCDLYTEWKECELNETFYNECMDSCLPKCDEWVFEYLLSETMHAAQSSNETPIANVYIRYDKMMYIKFEEVEAFTMDMAIANVGGQCGLWLGASFVTIIQAVYYLLLAVAEKVVNKK